MIILYLSQVVTNDGDTPFHIAAAEDQVGVVSACLAQKHFLFDSRAISRDMPKNNAGMTPLDVAARNDSLQSAHIIVGKLEAKAEMRFWEKIPCEL